MKPIKRLDMTDMLAVTRSLVHLIQTKGSSDLSNISTH